MHRSVKEYRETLHPIRIRARARKKHFWIEIIDADRQRDIDFKSPVSPTAVRRAAARLRAHLETEVFKPSIFGAWPDRRAAAIRELAVRGRNMLRALFPDKTLPRFIAALGRGRPARAEVRDDLVLLPWEFLYLGKIVDGVEIDETLFLGRVAQFTRVTSCTNNGSWTPSDTFSTDDPFGPSYDVNRTAGRVLTGRVFDEKLSSMRAPASDHWHNRYHALLDIMTLKQLSFDTEEGKAEGRSQLLTFMGEGHEVIHFDCHATAETEENEYAIRVSSGFMAGLTDVGTWDLRRNPDVFVFLNCCYSDHPGQSGESAARLLQRNGGRAVIGTSVCVDDGFALTFARTFYGHLLNGLPVGQALFETQELLIKNTKNPLALIYTLHGTPEHTLASH